MFRETTKIIKRSKKEVIYKIITSLFIQGLALIIPVFWSNTINEVTDGNYKIGDGFIKFSTCRKFKGLEADAIIMIDADNDIFTTNEGRLLYYVGTSRAKLQLDIISTFTDDDCKNLLQNTFEYKRKIKNPKRDFASVLKCHEYIE